jgi:hypothetical protein
VQKGSSASGVTTVIFIPGERRGNGFLSPRHQALAPTSRFASPETVIKKQQKQEGKTYAAPP